LTHDLIRRRHRSFLADCQAMVAQIAGVWEDVDYLPSRGPVCLVANHYQRRGLWIGWAGALISVAVADRRHGQTPRWLVLGDLPWRIGPGTVPFPGARWAFHRVADAWGLVPTTGFRDPGDRAASLRRLIHLARDSEVIGLFPEGPSGTSDRLRPALPGLGRFLALLQRRGVVVIPVGVREENGKLVARFGSPIDPLSRSAEDTELGIQVMRHIASCAVTMPGDRPRRVVS
jgi:1-acyl-sn-glycerol-3-phosphate acyltransferase